MDFFAAQDHARKLTKWLIGLYVLTVLCIILSIYGLSVFVYFGQLQEDKAATFSWWQPTVFIWISGIVAAIVLFASLHKIHSLSSGGEAVARLLGGCKVNANTTDPNERRLLNVVEEMAIASGMPAPSVFVMPEESGINAFAAGFSIYDAAVVVAKGSLEQLNRDELQGVVAHEFSHILNGDMRLNLRLMGVLFGIQVLGILGREVLFSMRHFSRSRDGAKAALPMMLLAAGMMAIGYIGLFFARIIQCAISRQRECLADASAVQFTRNPEGIARALMKAGKKERSFVSNVHAEEVSHMFFLPHASHLFATHPPIDRRIRTIYPQWDGNYLAAQQSSTPQKNKPSHKETTKPKASSPMNITGQPSVVNLVFAQAILESISNDLRVALQDPERARAFVFVLLLANDTAVLERQFTLLEERRGEKVQAQVRNMWELAYAQGVGERERLPLLELALTSLRELDEAQSRAFLEDVDALIYADEVLSPFEFVLQRIVKRSLSIHLGDVATSSKRRLPSLGEPMSLAASYVARLDCLDEKQCASMIKDALSETPLLEEHVHYVCAEVHEDMHALEDALDAIATANFFIRQQFLTLCAALIMSDDKMTPREGEFFRAFACGIDCPMPPLS